MKTAKLKKGGPLIIRRKTCVNNRVNQCETGLTLLDALILIAFVVIATIILLPRMTDTGHPNIRIKCLNKVKENALGLVSYAIDNNDLFPPAPAGQNHLPWDVPWAPFEVLQRDGLTRDLMYDPAFTQQNDDRLWNAASNNYRVIGYALTLPGAGSTVTSYNQNFDCSESPAQSNQLGPNLPDPSQRVLVADPIISLPGQNDPRLVATYQWKNIPGGLPDGTQTASGSWSGFRTSHFDKRGKLPLGGNVGMMDGHAVWHPFDGMIPRTTGAGNTPIFWW